MSEPLTVLHVVDCLNVGGTERQMFELLRRLDRRRYRPLLACFHGRGELTDALVEMGITPYEFPLYGSLARPNTAVQIGRMAHLLVKERVGVVHAHDFYSNLIAVPAAGIARVPSIASRRDLGHWFSTGKRRVLSAVLSMADRVLANAHAVGALAAREEHVAATKLRVVPNGIDLQRFDALAAVEPSPPLPERRPGRQRVAMVASMHLPDKGHIDLLDAAVRLRDEGVRADWILVSDGVLRPRLEEAARVRGLGEDVHFLGRRGDVPAILARVDLVAHPSWAEGFPNAVLEGMAAARAVVATRAGGIPEVLVDGRTGVLVPPREPDALARALAFLLASPERAAAMGRAGRRRVEEHFSLERMTQAVEALYDELAPPRSARLRANA
jgi:glycosyltransferase involved in cell wall biosynthesis